MSDDIWKTYAQSVKRIKSTKKVTLAKPSSVSPATRQAAEKHAGAIVFTAPDKKPLTDWAAPLGRNMERDLRSGDALIDARVDLHGMTQDEAYKTIARFVASHVKRGSRTLLVITGRGSVLQGGVLRSHLRLWLESLPDADRILRMTQAAAAHGGTGAFYVVLKRKRE